MPSRASAWRTDGQTDRQIELLEYREGVCLHKAYCGSAAICGKAMYRCLRTPTEYRIGRTRGWNQKFISGGGKVGGAFPSFPSASFPRFEVAPQIQQKDSGKRCRS